MRQRNFHPSVDECQNNPPNSAHTLFFTVKLKHPSGGTGEKTYF